MKIGNFFFNVGFIYKTGGIKAVWNYYNIAIKIKIMIKVPNPFDKIFVFILLIISIYSII